MVGLSSAGCKDKIRRHVKEIRRHVREIGRHDKEIGRHDKDMGRHDKDAACPQEGREARLVSSPQGNSDVLICSSRRREENSTGENSEREYLRKK